MKRSEPGEAPGGSLKRVPASQRESTIYDINRCRKCGGVVTKRQILRAFKTGKLPLCPCGSSSISPGNVLWFDWFKPRVWAQALDVLRFGPSGR